MHLHAFACLHPASYLRGRKRTATRTLLRDLDGPGGVGSIPPTADGGLDAGMLTTLGGQLGGPPTGEEAAKVGKSTRPSAPPGVPGVEGTPPSVWHLGLYLQLCVLAHSHPVLHTQGAPAAK